MIKLKEIIGQLEDEAYSAIETNLVKTKADNFLLLLRSYRKGISERETTNKLKISQNSFYVLKSRLYGKIQEHLSGNTFDNRESTLKQLLHVPEVCFNQPREIAIAFLEKLETELLHFDMHNELQVVYSALKKMHLHSDKYFLYSQLFNKQVALGLSLEKAEEVLGNFNRILGRYDFSRSLTELETLNFLKSEMTNMYALNSSRQIQIINNLMRLELIIFCSGSNLKEESADELLQETRKLFSGLPQTADQKKWEITLDHLCFEHYLAIREYKIAQQYYENVNKQVHSFLLFNNVSLTSKFLISKIRYCYELDRMNGILVDPTTTTLLYDVNDSHAAVTVALYNAMLYFTQKNYKNAIGSLNRIINMQSFKDYFHGNMNIKLTLAYFYIETQEFDKAEIIIKSISRKIKSEKHEAYRHVLNLIKIFEMEINQSPGVKTRSKIKDLFTLFVANNTRGNEILAHLVPSLKKKYQS